jgi:HAD superfamily hydrolase (TIGR01509 family)
MRPHASATILFDCDGVLIDSEVIACEIETEILAEIGHPITAAAFATRFIGTSRSQSVAALEADWGRPLPADYVERVRDRLESAFHERLRAVPGMLALVRGRDPYCAVASSSSRARLALTLGLTGFAGLFDHRIFSAEQVVRGKPAPDLFLFAARSLGVSPERCIVVEDSPFGIAAALAAGMRAIGFVAGSHCAPDLSRRLIAAGAVTVAADAAALSRCLAELDP